MGHSLPNGETGGGSNTRIPRSGDHWGMEGVFEELKLFVIHNPSAIVLPLASAGAAAAIIHREGNYDEELSRNLTFLKRFQTPAGYGRRISSASNSAICPG
jgi:hypothetical protein